MIKKYANVVAEVFCGMYKNMVALKKYLTYSFSVTNKGP
jgi:Mn-containing catalase